MNTCRLRDITCFNLWSLQPRDTVLNPLANFPNLRTPSPALQSGWTGDTGHGYSGWWHWHLNKHFLNSYPTLHQHMYTPLILHKHHHSCCSFWRHRRADHVLPFLPQPAVPPPLAQRGWGQPHVVLEGQRRYLSGCHLVHLNADFWLNFWLF